MTSTTIGYCMIAGGTLGFALLGIWDVIERWNRRANRDIAEHIDKALGRDLLDEDQAIGITRDGSHDRVRLTAAEHRAYRQILLGLIEDARREETP